MSQIEMKLERGKDDTEVQKVMDYIEQIFECSFENRYQSSTEDQV